MRSAILSGRLLMRRVGVGGWGVLKGVYAAQVRLVRWNCSCNPAVHDIT